MNIFSSAYSSQYDHFYAKKDYRGECDLIETAVKSHAGGAPHALLDIGCGTGGHAIELAERGYQVTGVDRSQSMLDEAVRKSAVLPSLQRPTWHCGDARDFDTGRTFELGIMMFAVMGYMTTNDDVLNCLRNIRRHLQPGALFLCDFWYGPSVIATRPTERVSVFETPAGRVIRAASTTMDISQHTADVQFRLWTLRDGYLASEANETHRMRYFFPQEFSLFLEVSGFALRSMTAFPSLAEPLSAETWNAFVVAQAF